MGTCLPQFPARFKLFSGTSLVVQWLRLCAFTAKGLGLIPCQGSKIPQATWCGQKNPSFSLMVKPFFFRIKLG